MRFDIYGLIHKAQRKFLFDLSSKIAKTDPEDIKQCEWVEGQVQWIAQHLKEHSHTEETYIHPLFQKIGVMHHELDHEHEDFDPALDRLTALASKKDLPTLYRELNLFIASYLQHQAKEERAQEDILWKHFDDKQLAEVMSNFLASKSKHDIVKDLEFLMPTMTIHEAMKIFSAGNN